MVILISGLTGLYRGISTNVASSAPISAVYTFTYESVKGALLPLFPKVPLLLCNSPYHFFSLEHCQYASPFPSADLCISLFIYNCNTHVESGKESE